MDKPVRTLLPMAADGVGPSFTCLRLTEGLHDAGADIELRVTRARMVLRHPPTRALLTGPLARLPYRWVKPVAEPYLEQTYLKRLRPGDIAWLWPSVSLQTHEAVAALGNPIVLEGINTRMKAARMVLDAAYDAFGAAPGHGITQARIDEEENKYALADAIFAPSAGVEAALAGSVLEHRFLRSSYGVDTRQTLASRLPQTDGTVRFLFVGHACVRKGIHHLLDLWPHMPTSARLRLVGRIEPVIAERYADLLSSERVEAIGFTRDVAPHYAASDVFVFPSLEEGDPLVTYEAALNGLPIIASTPGAGRMGADRDVVRLIQPTDRDDFLAALLALHDDPTQRRHAGECARAAVADYDWQQVAAKRATDLAALYEAPPPGPETLRTSGSDALSTRTSPHPTVSVVLPAYNRATTIIAAIDSVLRQTWQDFELIVVDDGSTDGTPDVVRALQNPRIRLIEQAQNAGPSAARNRGMREAQGTWVAFQDSDDEWLPEKLARQMARLSAPQTDWIGCYCGMLIVGTVVATAGRTTIRYHPQSTFKSVEGDIRESLMRTSLISTQMLIARRDLLERIGGFDEALPALEDWDLALRLSEHGRFAFVDEPLVLQRFSDNSITRDQTRRIIARARILEKHQNSWPAAALAQQYRTLAGEHRDQGNLRAAAQAVAKARALRPMDIGLLIRSLALVFLSVVKGTRADRTPPSA